MKIVLKRLIFFFSFLFLWFLLLSSPLVKEVFALSYSSSDCGRTIILDDGTYDELTVSANCSASTPLTIRARNDGRVIIDGDMVRGTVFSARGSSFVNIEGIRFQNSAADTFYVSQSSDLNFRRISAYNSGDGNVHVITIDQSSNILMEDAAASGKGRNLYLIYESDQVTLRRCWGWWKARNGTGEANYVLQIYASDNTLVENCVGTIDPNPSVNNVSGLAYWIASWNQTDSCNNNKVIGNVYYGFNFHDLWHGHETNIQNNNSFINSVLIGGGYTSIFQRGGKNFTLGNTTLVNQNKSWSTFRIDNYAGDNPNAIIKNSVFVAGSIAIDVATGASVNHSYNDFYNVSQPFSGTSQGIGEIYDNPGYDTAKYGKGAYLISPQNLRGRGEGGTNMGAEILYQYENGALTTKPLWPWPMEDRIHQEMTELFGQQVSATWEVNGGLWKTLDGVYNSLPSAAPTIPKPTATSTPSFYCWGENDLIDSDDVLQWAVNYLENISSFDLIPDNKINGLEFGWLVQHWNEGCYH